MPEKRREKAHMGFPAPFCLVENMRYPQSQGIWLENINMIHRGAPEKKNIFSDFTMNCWTFPERKKRSGFKNVFPGPMP